MLRTLQPEHSRTSAMLTDVKKVLLMIRVTARQPLILEPGNCFKRAMGEVLHFSGKFIISIEFLESLYVPVMTLTSIAT